MTIETRLANMKRYLEQALKQPNKNKLYIEDLQLSIPMFEEAIRNNKVVVQKGFVLFTVFSDSE